MIKVKSTGTRRHDAKRTRDIVRRLTEASLAHRRVDMTYDSASSRRRKSYVVDPHRLTAADGGIYLTAWVEAYGEMRTFAVERIRTLGVRDDRFELRPLPAEPFANSLGPFSGSPEVSEIQFDAEIADYIASREWHRSQQITVRVLAPASLAREIYEEFDAARERYMPKLPFDSLRSLRAGRLDPTAPKPEPLKMWMDVEERLPFAAGRA